MSLDEQNYGSELAGSTATDGYLTYGVENAYGVIDVGGVDTDWYRVYTDIGSTYVFTLLPSSFDGSSSPGATFDIRDSFGNILAYSSNLSGQSQQWVGVASSANYYIEVRSPAAGGYAIRAANISVVEPQQATPLTGSTVWGHLSYTSQEDSYVVQLVAGVTYHGQMTSATFVNPYVSIDNGIDQRGFSAAIPNGQTFDYTPTTNGTYYLRVSSNNYTGRGDYTINFLTPTPAPLPTPVVTPPPAQVYTPSIYFAAADTTNNGPVTSDAGEIYAGPVVGVQHQFISVAHDNLAITATRPNSFIHTGSGDDAIDVSKVGGTNVLDGSTGSNFLVGGSGFDTFFVDDRAPTSNIWSTIVGFHSGDNATVWGVRAADFPVLLDNQGAVGAKGLTGGFVTNGRTVNATLAGYSSADIGTRLTITFGTTAAAGGVAGSDYMNVHAN